VDNERSGSFAHRFYEKFNELLVDAEVDRKAEKVSVDYFDVDQSVAHLANASVAG